MNHWITADGKVQTHILTIFLREGQMPDTPVLSCVTVFGTCSDHQGAKNGLRTYAGDCCVRGRVKKFTVNFTNTERIVIKPISLCSYFYTLLNGVPFNTIWQGYILIVVSQTHPV